MKVQGFCHWIEKKKKNSSVPTISYQITVFFWSPVWLNKIKWNPKPWWKMSFKKNCFQKVLIIFLRNSYDIYGRDLKKKNSTEYRNNVNDTMLVYVCGNQEWRCLWNEKFKLHASQSWITCDLNRAICNDWFVIDQMKKKKKKMDTKQERETRKFRQEEADGGNINYKRRGMEWGPLDCAWVYGCPQSLTSLPSRFLYNTPFPFPFLISLFPIAVNSTSFTPHSSWLFNYCHMCNLF